MRDRPSGLKRSALRQGHADTVADDDVIEQPDVDQPEGVAYAQRDAFVGKARLGNARRVVVGVL